MMIASNGKKVVPLCLIMYEAMKILAAWLFTPCILNLGTGCEWEDSLFSGSFTPRKNAPSLDCIGGPVNSKASVDVEAKWKVPGSAGNRITVFQPLVVHCLL
jgi:hypothetical protein